MSAPRLEKYRIPCRYAVFEQYTDILIPITNLLKKVGRFNFETILIS